MSGSGRNPTITDLDLDADTDAVAALLADLVAGGAALGWVEPPPAPEIAALLAELREDTVRGDADVRVARVDGVLAGFGYWRRYLRPTHRPHADLARIAVDRTRQGTGLGRALLQALVDSATRGGIEQLTLDVRGDNAAAIALYESLGFRRYGRLEGFVAVGGRRYDTVFYVLDLRARSS